MYNPDRKKKNKKPFQWNPFNMFSEAPNGQAFISMGGSGSKSESKPVQLPAWSGPQQNIAASLFDVIQAGMAKPVPSYPGNMYVPELPAETAYLSNAANWTTQLAGLRANMAGPAFEITPETTEQYYQEAVKAPMMQEYREITEPAIREAFVGPGYWGSARAQAQANGAEHLATTLGAARANLAYADEMARRESLESAAAREATYGPATVGAEANMMGSAAQYARAIDQEKVLGDLQRWLAGETIEGVTPEQYNPYLQLAFQALGLSPYVYGTESESKSFGASGGVSGGGK